MADRPDLKWLVEFSSEQAEKIFRQTGQLLPMYHAILPDGHHQVIPAPDTDKDVAVALIKAAFELMNVDTYIFMSEAWMLIAPNETPDLAKIARRGLEHHPDRREIIMFQAENRRGERQSASRFILRPEHGKARLAPLKMDDMSKFGKSEGRMVGLLQMEK